MVDVLHCNVTPCPVCILKVEFIQNNEPLVNKLDQLAGKKKKKLPLIITIP